MATTHAPKSEFSHNQLSVTGTSNNVNVHYGNVYSQPQDTSNVSWTDIIKWIFDSEKPFSQKVFQDATQRRRSERSTGSWLFQGDAFSRWRREDKSVLWLCGKMGSGKTTLCSSAIQHLQPDYSPQTNRALVYHFFTLTDRRSQSNDTMIKTLLYQLATHNERTRAHVQSVYRQANDSGEVNVSTDSLSATFKSLLELLDGTCIILDAFDESSDQKQTCAFLDLVCGWSLPNVRLIVSSNSSQAREAEAVLRKLTTERVYLNTASVNRDIAAHIKSVDMSQWDDVQKEAIMNRILEHSQGSFRWAVGQLAEIEGCDTEEELEHILASLPGSLAEIYNRVLSRITADAAIKNLRTLLCWLLYSARPLTLDELRDAAAIDWLTEPYFDPKRRLNRRPRILDQCTLLIVLDDTEKESFPFSVSADESTSSASATLSGSSVLRLAHSSVFQFLQDDEKLSEHARRFAVPRTIGHLMLAQSSLAYLLHLDSSNAVLSSQRESKLYPLVTYAVEFWYHHTQEAETSTTKGLDRLLEAILKTTSDIYLLVTYPNVSARFDAWMALPISDEQFAEYPDLDKELCKVCKTIQPELLRAGNFTHRTYNEIINSGHECPACRMIQHAIIEFGVARHFQAHPRGSSSEQELVNLTSEVDLAIRRIAGNMPVHLSLETEDSFVLLRCFYFFGRLRLYAKANGAFSDTVRGRPLHWNFKTPSVLALCSSWLRSCQENHRQCSNDDVLPTLPTRVLDVEGDDVRLVISKGHQARYLTLTWRWDTATTSSEIQLLHSRLEAYQTRIPWDSLPSIHRDAIAVARTLGVRYLWIDMLCIIQQNNDWTSEASQFGRIYADATLNIVAGTAGSGRGFLVPRLQPRFLPCRLGGDGSDGGEATFLSWAGNDAFCYPRGAVVNQYIDGWRYSSPIHRRGWAMQEMHVAQRNLVFQTDEVMPSSPDAPSVRLASQLYMQCRHEVRWESGKTRRTDSAVTVSDAASDSWSAWYRLVETFSRLQMTYYMDRLFAMGVMAENHDKTSTVACGQYLAGLWLSDIYRGLLWCADPATPSRPAEWVAPSWSWASVTGKVRHIWPEKATLKAKVVACSTSLQTQWLYGNVVNASVTIEGKLVSLRVPDNTLRTWTDAIVVRIFTGEDEEQARTMHIKYFLDTTSVLTEPSIIGALYALRIIRRVGLLLRKVESSHTYARVGLFIISKYDADSWVGDVPQSQVQIV